MDNTRPIGIFDSGLGGLTVMKEIAALLPNENIIYFGDTGRVPYGSKSSETIRKYARQNEKFLLSKNVKLIVAACGTVSAVAADTGKELPVPFIEVISHAAKDAVDTTINKKIGVIGTSATICSHAHEQAILKLNPNCSVTSVGCPLFVPLVEEGFASSNNPAVAEIAREYLKPICAAGVDTLILGCTHYPLLKNTISQIMGKDVNIINMGKSTATAVKKMLEENGTLNASAVPGFHKYFVSDMTESFEKTTEMLLGEIINSKNAKQVDISKL